MNRHANTTGRSRQSLIHWAATMAESHLALALPRRWAHAKGVARAGARVGAAILTPGDAELLVAAALLHDIGYAPVLVDTGYHPIDGGRFVIGQRAEPRLANLVANHSAARPIAEVRGLGVEVAAFPDERTALRDALWYCDMRVSPAGEPVSFDARIADIRARHGSRSPLVRALDAGALDARRDAVRRTELRMAGAAAARGQVVVPRQAARGQVVRG